MFRGLLILCRNRGARIRNRLDCGTTLSSNFDVHSSFLSADLAEVSVSPHFFGKYPNSFRGLLEAFDRQGGRDHLRVASEAGLTGPGFKKSLAEAWIRCDVIAPSKMPKAASDKIESDPGDAFPSALILRCGDLSTLPTKLART